MDAGERLGEKEANWDVVPGEIVKNGNVNRGRNNLDFNAGATANANGTFLWCVFNDVLSGCSVDPHADAAMKWKATLTQRVTNRCSIPGLIYFNNFPPVTKVFDPTMASTAIPFISTTLPKRPHRPASPR